jgi:hypothetical protein
MEFYEARNKLRRMSKEKLFELASKQGISRCVIGGKECRLYFRYEGLGFCVSEILGQGCQVQRTKILENCHEDTKEADSPPPLTGSPNANRTGFESTLLHFPARLSLHFRSEKKLPCKYERQMKKERIRYVDYEL